MQASGDILTALYTRGKITGTNEIGKGQDYEIGNSAGCAEQKKISLLLIQKRTGAEVLTLCSGG